jgi:hypothetical protein
MASQVLLVHIGAAWPCGLETAGLTTTSTFMSIPELEAFHLCVHRLCDCTNHLASLIKSQIKIKNNLPYQKSLITFLKSNKPPEEGVVINFISRLTWQKNLI